MRTFPLRILGAFLATGLLAGSGQTAMALTLTDVGSLHRTSLIFGGGYEGHPPAAEVPPSISGSPRTTGQRGYNVTTAYTYRCDQPAALFAVARIDCTDRHDVHLISSDLIHFSAGPRPSSAAGDLRRNYNGVFSVERLRHAGRSYLLFLNHAENKNGFLGTYPESAGPLWDNTIDTSVRASDPGSECAVGIPGWAGTTEAAPDIAASGNRRGGHVECWGAYNGLIAASRIPFNARNAWGTSTMPTSLGPIVWPAAGYVDAAGKKTSFGVRHPSSLRDGRYVYLFYLDTSDGGTVRIARAPVAELGRGPSWRSWNGSCWCIRSTPPGLTRGNYRRFWATPLTAQRRGAPANVLPDAMGTVRFAVARYRPHHYLGVEQYVTPDRVCHVALRASVNLLRWSRRTGDIDAGSCSGPHPMEYPVPLDSDGWSNERIDLDDFYLVGTHAGEVYTRHIGVSP